MTRAHTTIPDRDTRAALNAALLTTGADTGFWDEHGRPAPWPDDIDQWRPCTTKPVELAVGEQPF